MITNIPLRGIFGVSCEYHRANSDDLNWGAGFHPGIDLISDDDTVWATCDGVVVNMGYDNSYGHFIVICNDADFKYHWFCHLRHMYPVIGQRVSRESIIGLMGETGNATGKHLHFEIRNSSNKYGDVADPADYMGIPNKVGTYNDKNYPIYRSHLQDIGNQCFVSPYHVSGTTGQSRRMEAIQLMSSEVEYRVHLQDIGWMNWVKGGTFIGTTGESRRLEAIEFDSKREMIVDGHVQDIGWQGEQRGKNIVIGTTGQSKRLEAFRFRFV